MNRAPRVLMVGRHYWPHGSLDAANALLQTACALHRRGAHVEVLSPRYASSWPETIVVREIPLHRAVAAPRYEWGIGRYLRGLTHWLQAHAGSFDVLFVDSIREEALAAMEGARSTGTKTLLRCRGWGRSSDPEWWRSARWGRRCVSAAKAADAVIANSAEAERQLLIEGIEPDRIERIPQGFMATPGRSSQRRREARRALAAVNGDLFAEPDDPVLLCNARMIRNEGIDLLVAAAQPLLVRYPNLRIWFVGDGPYRDSMYQRLRADGVRASIAMPGSFADPEDLFVAADVYLQTDDDGMEYFLPTAIAWELPVVAVDLPSVRTLLDAGRKPDGLLESEGSMPSSVAINQVRPSDWVEWCPNASPKGVRIGVSNVLDQLTEARQRAGELRRFMLRTRPYHQTTDAYLGLIERLIAQSGPTHRNPHTEAVS